MRTFWSVCVLSVKGTISEVRLRDIVVQGDLRARREKRPQGGTIRTEQGLLRVIVLLVEATVY